jgi:hypothetical protein
MLFRILFPCIILLASFNASAYNDDFGPADIQSVIIDNSKSQQAFTYTITTSFPTSGTKPVRMSGKVTYLSDSTFFNKAKPRRHSMRGIIRNNEIVLDEKNKDIEVYDSAGFEVTKFNFKMNGISDASYYMTKYDSLRRPVKYIFKAVNSQTVYDYEYSEDSITVIRGYQIDGETKYLFNETYLKERSKGKGLFTATYTNISYSPEGDVLNRSKSSIETKKIFDSKGRVEKVITEYNSTFEDKKYKVFKSELEVRYMDN